MLNKIIEFSVKQKYIALSLVVLMAVGGFFALKNIPINSQPDVTPVQVLVITKAGRYSPYDVEKLVSYPIENSMNGLPDVKEVRSISQFGLSAVTIEFDENTDIYFARQLVSQRIQSVADELPQGVSAPQLGPVSTAMGEIYQYQVKGAGYSLTELRTIHDWLIIPQLKTVRGVTEINSFGGFVKQYDIIIHPGKLRQFDIGLNTVFDAVENNNSVAGGNYLEHNREQYIIRGVGQIESMDDIRRIIVKNVNGKPVYVNDIANVKEGKQIRQGAVTRDGKGEIVTGIVMMLRGGNGREVISNIEERIDDVNESLPEGVKIEKFYDQSDLISRTTHTLSKNLIEGGLLVIVILLLLLGDLRGAIIVALVIPLSMLFAFIGMWELGLAANLMSLGAIDFGMVVDGSVVMVENIIHRSRHYKNMTRDEMVIKAAKQVARPIFFGVLIILVVYIPVMTFSGMEGILYRPMALTVGMAVFGSLLLALVFVPAMMRLTYRKPKEGKKPKKENRIIAWLKPRYRNFLDITLKHKWRTIGVALLVFAVSMFLMTRLGSEFLPELDEGSILIEEVRMPSVTLEESVEKADELAADLMANIPEIKTVVPKTGRSDLANDWMGVHQTDIWVILKERDEWRDGLEKQDIIDEIEPYLADEPGLSYNFTQPIAMRVDELTSGVKSDLAVVIYGESLDSLKAVGDRIAGRLGNLEGTDNFYVDQPVGQPYLTIEADREALASFGLNVSDVQAVIEAGIGGKTVSDMFRGQRRFAVQVRYPEGLRDNFTRIREIPVQLPDGGFVPLSRVTKITAQEGPREIQRENGWRRLIVGININNIDMGSYVDNLQSMIKRDVDVPAGYFINYGGSFENQQRAMNHLFLVVPLVLFLIIGLLYISFGRMRYALLVFLNLPLALSGGVFLLWIRDMYLSVSASIGFIALFGVAVLNGIVLVSHLNELRKDGEGLREAVIDGAADRLRPVLMTALVASLGFVPMAFNTGPGSEVQSPLATVVIGGLITATLLTLLVLPTVYHWMEKGNEIKK
jgi:cobalt-zinc-cadmium resistance protein CzcA